MANQERQTTHVGEWWLPDQPDHTMHGTLTIGPRYAELELYDRATSDRAPVELPVIYGRSMGTALTLLANVQTDAPSAGRGVDRLVRRLLIVGTVLIGESHLREEDVRFNRASLRLANLNEWVNRSPYSRETGPPETMQLVDDLPVLRASVPGCEILLGRTASTYFNRLAGAGFSSHEVIELQLDERLPLEELEYQFVRPLEQLLTLASGFDSKTFDLRVGIEDDGDGLPWEATAHSVQHRSFDHDQNERLVVRPHMRFGMNSNGYPPDIDFGDLVPRWFELQAALSDVCDLIFSLRSDTPATCNNSCSRSPQRSRLCIVDSIHSWRRRPTKIEPATPRPLRPCRRSIQSIASGWRTSSRMRTSRVTPSGFRSCWRRPVR